MLWDINIIPNELDNGYLMLPPGVLHMSALGRFGRFTLFSPRVSHSKYLPCSFWFVLCFGFGGFVALLCFWFPVLQVFGIPNSPRSLDLDDRQGLIASSAMQQKKPLVRPDLIIKLWVTLSLNLTLSPLLMTSPTFDAASCKVAHQLTFFGTWRLLSLVMGLWFYHLPFPPHDPGSDPLRQRVENGGRTPCPDILVSFSDSLTLSALNVNIAHFQLPTLDPG